MSVDGNRAVLWWSGESGWWIVADGWWQWWRASLVGVKHVIPRFPSPFRNPANLLHPPVQTHHLLTYYLPAYYHP